MLTNQELYNPSEITSESIEDGEIIVNNCSNCGFTGLKIYRITNKIDLCEICYHLYKQHLCDNIFVPSKLRQINDKQICENCYQRYIDKIFGYKCVVCKIIKKTLIGIKTNMA